jgi:hypothetical protein
VFIVHGIYKFWRRPVAFRNDYCLKCDRTQLAVRLRSLYVLHLFWVPVLPLGLWGTWICGRCGSNPHDNVRTRRTFKILLVIVLLCVATVVWILPPQPGKPWEIWLFRVAVSIGLLLAIWWAAWGHRVEPTLRACLESVPPYDLPDCPFCGGQILGIHNARCSACGIERWTIGNRL